MSRTKPNAIGYLDRKRPIWVSVEAHERLKTMAAESDRTMLELVSSLILEAELTNSEGPKPGEGSDNG